MLLAIDAGNTNIVFALHDGKEIIHKWRISSADSRTADEYMVWLSQLLNFPIITYEESKLSFLSHYKDTGSP